MKKQGMYSFLPRKIQDRTSYFNPINLIFNFESCYTQDNFFLRDKILSHRAAANFQDEILEGESTWFASELHVAFEDLNAGSYVLAPQKRPRASLSMNDFRVVQQAYVKFAWSSLSQLEVDLGDFLLTRNRIIAEGRPEHLNDPMNYFFVDIKRMMRLMSREPNIGMISDTMSSMLHYINYVETELPFDSQDRIFISQLRESINKKVLPQINEKKDSENLKLKLTTLIDEIDRVADTCHRELHYDFQDTDINPHVSHVTTQIEDGEKIKHPLQALLGCAEHSKNTNAVSIIDEFNADFLFTQGMDKTFSLHVLDSCQDVHLISGLSAAEKSAYLELASSIDQFIKYKSLLSSLLSFIDEVGQYQVLMGYQTELSEFLNVIKKNIALAQEKRAFLSSVNLAIKNRLLNKHHQEGTFTKLYNYVGEFIGLTEKSINAENFMRNQDVKQLTSVRDPERTFEVATAVIEQTLEAMNKWHASYTDDEAVLQLSGNYQKLISDIKQLSGASIPSIEAPSLFEVDEEEEIDEEVQRWLDERDTLPVLGNVVLPEALFSYHGEPMTWQHLLEASYPTGTSLQMDQQHDFRQTDRVQSQLIGNVVLAGVLVCLTGKFCHWTFKSLKNLFTGKNDVTSKMEAAAPQVQLAFH